MNNNVVLFESLPKGMQEEIIQAAPGNLVQIQSGGHTLAISDNGVIRFDGKLVIMPGQDPNMYDNEPTEIHAGKLPRWAKDAIGKTGDGSTSMLCNGCSLQISQGIAIFNGMLVK